MVVVRRDPDSPLRPLWSGPTCVTTLTTSTRTLHRDFRTTCLLLERGPDLVIRFMTYQEPDHSVADIVYFCKHSLDRVLRSPRWSSISSGRVMFYMALNALADR